MSQPSNLNHDKIIIDFECADISFDVKESNLAIKDWLITVIKNESGNVSRLCYIFCSDDYLYDLNLRYLEHDTLTDVITFPLEEDPIEGDIFISIDRIRENAKNRSIAFELELKRVMVHGLLHLLGYRDKSNVEIALIRRTEDKYLSLLHS